MFKKGNASTGKLSAGWRALRWYPVFLFLPLLLGAPTPGQMTPRRVRLYFNLDIVGISTALCAGQTYTVSVTVSSATTPFSQDPGTHTVGRSWRGIDVSASSGDQSIATVTPPRRKTEIGSSAGSSEEEDELPPLPLTPMAAFELRALKAGTTTFNAQALVPRSISRGASFVLARTTTFKVVNCNYRLVLSYYLKLRGKAGHADADGWLKDVMRIKLDPNTEQLSGTGVVSSVVQGGTKGIDDCEDDPMSTENQVVASGKLDGDQLALKLQLNKSEFQVTERCKRYVPNSWVPLPPHPRQADKLWSRAISGNNAPGGGGLGDAASPVPA